jgi:hypothetical protein
MLYFDVRQGETIPNNIGISTPAQVPESATAMATAGLSHSLLAHPNVPCERSCLLIAHRAPRQLEGQLYLTVMVSLVPDHVLKHKDRMVVVQVHVADCFHSALHRPPQRPRAVVQHLGDAVTVTLDHPFFLGYVPGELGCVLGHQDQSSIVDVGER